MSMSMSMSMSKSKSMIMIKVCQVMLKDVDPIIRVWCCVMCHRVIDSMVPA